MRKILLAFLMMAGAVCLKAQNPNVPTISVSVAPSGSCGGSQVRYLTPNGTLYTCQSGTWAVMAGGGGSPTGAAGGDLGGTYPNPTVTGGSHLTSGSTVVAQKFFVTAAPGSIAGNLPGDTATDTTNHLQYVCNAPSGTVAPACTSVTAAGWLLLGSTGTVTNITTTGPISGGPITTTGAISCPTCVTSAASLTSLGAMVGGGGQAAQTSSQFTVSNLGTPGTETWALTNTGLGTTPAGGHALTNTTAAAAGVQQVSPPMIWTGQGWKTTATAASQSVAFQAYVLPVQGTAAPNALLNFASSINGAGYVVAGGFNAATASATVPNVFLGSNSGTGIGSRSGGTVFDVAVNGANGLEIQSTAVIVPSAFSLAWTAPTPDLFMSRFAAATIQHGAADAAAPVAQTIRTQSVVAGTSNTAGVNLTIQGSAGTGTGAGGSIIFQTSAASTTGSTQNAVATALTIDSTKLATFAGSLRFNGTNSTGAGSALLGTNSPAVTLTAPYTWITVITSDGSTGFIPIWK